MPIAVDPAGPGAVPVLGAEALHLAWVRHVWVARSRFKACSWDQHIYLSFGKIMITTFAIFRIRFGGEPLMKQDLTRTEAIAFTFGSTNVLPSATEAMRPKYICLICDPQGPFYFIMSETRSTIRKARESETHSSTYPHLTSCRRSHFYHLDVHCVDVELDHPLRLRLRNLIESWGGLWDPQVHCDQTLWHIVVC